MIMLTKLNDDRFVINSNQIQMIEMIPESKVVLMNKEFFVVKESTDEIIDLIVAFEARIYRESGVMVVKQQEERNGHGA